jgi:hypothetical protein
MSAKEDITASSGYYAHVIHEYPPFLLQVKKPTAARKAISRGICTQKKMK